MNLETNLYLVKFSCQFFCDELKGKAVILSANNKNEVANTILWELAEKSCVYTYFDYNIVELGLGHIGKN